MYVYGQMFIFAYVQSSFAYTYGSFVITYTCMHIARQMCYFSYKYCSYGCFVSTYIYVYTWLAKCVLLHIHRAHMALHIYSFFSNIHLVHTNADDIADICHELIYVTNSDTSRTHYVYPIS